MVKKIYDVFPELAYLGIEVSPGTSEFFKNTGQFNQRS